MAPTAFAMDMPWFQQWFKPVFDLARQHGTTVQLPLPQPGVVPRLFQEAGFQDVRVETLDLPWYLDDADASVYAMVQGVSLFQRELEPLPWRARRDVVEALKERGRRVCARTAPEARVIHNPVEMVRGAV